MVTLVPTTALAADDAAEPQSLLPGNVLATADSASGDGSVDVSEKVVFNKQDTYPYTGAPVDFSPTCDDIKEWSFQYLDSNGSVLDDAPYEPGEYTVIITGYGTDCSARIEHTYRIVTGEIKYTVSGYSGEYDGKEHSITVEYDPNVYTVEYSKDGGASWQNENPTFKDVGSYTVYVNILKGSELVATDSATVTITKGTPELYFTPGNIVFQPGEKSRQLKWVYNGDGKLHFTSSDSRHFWVDPSGGLVSLNQEGGVSIWATAPETKNWKSVTAMCIVETESTLPQIDIDTKLEYNNPASELLQEKAVEISHGKGDLILYIDAKLIDPRDPEKKKELHNVRANITVPYEIIPMESAKPVTACDFTVLHQRIDGKIEQAS